MCCAFRCWSRNSSPDASIVGRLYCTAKAMWKLGWFLRDFLYDPELLTQDEIDEHALRGLVGVVKISHTVVNGVSLVNFDGFAPASQWEELSTSLPLPRCQLLGQEALRLKEKEPRDELQLHPDLAVCDLSSPLPVSLSRRLAGEGRPRRHAVRARLRAGAGRPVPRARSGGNLVRAVGSRQGSEPGLLRHDTWDSMLQQGVQLLERFVQDGRVTIPSPASQQQVPFTRSLSSANGFVAYIDAIGELDGTPCVLEWKTSSARYPEEPAGLTALDPQLVCYSWMTGIDEVAQVVFVRKRTVEVQYLRATITEEQRRDFENLVDDAVRRIESGLFLPQSGIRFPQNPCTTCPFVGLCLDQRELVETALLRKPGVDLGLFDELAY